MKQMLFIAALIMAPITAEAGGYREAIIPPTETGCQFFCFPKQDREDRPRPTRTTPEPTPQPEPEPEPGPGKEPDRETDPEGWKEWRDAKDAASG